MGGGSGKVVAVSGRLCWVGVAGGAFERGVGGGSEKVVEVRGRL